MEGQLIDLRGYDKARGLKVIQEYIDIASGSRNERKNYLKLFDDVRKRKTDVVLVWRFDRFARSTKDLINALEEYISLDVDFISFKENIDTSTPTGKILFTMISAFAEFERTIIRQRVKAGMEKAKAKWKSIGRPQVSQFTISAAREMKEKGNGYKDICKKLGISKSAYYQIINFTRT